MTYDEHVDCDNQIAQLTAENKKLRESIPMTATEVLCRRDMANIQAENKRLRTALEKIHKDWRTKATPQERDYNELVIIAEQALRRE